MYEGEVVLGMISQVVEGAFYRLTNDLTLLHLKDE